jgi:DNA-binding winged helix-turn-helix (wHTH) protein
MGEVAGSSASGRRAAAERLAGRPSIAAVEPEDAGRLEGQLRALQAATAAVAQLAGIERLAEVAAAAVRDGIGAEVLVIAILDEDGRRLRPAHVAARSGEAQQRSAPAAGDGERVLADVARSGRPVYRQSSSDDGMLAALPLLGTRGALGVIVFGRSGRRPLSGDDVAFLNVLAGLCAMAVECMQLSSERSRVREILRRRRLASRVAGTRLRVGRMRIDLEQLVVEIDGRSARLTPTEMRLLMFLADEPGRPRTRAEILRHLWQTDYVGGERACDAHIWNLRHKIERDPSSPQLVVTSRGVGYALEVG